MLKLVLFINDSETYQNFDYPLKGNEDLDPRPIYSRMHGLNKTDKFPDNYPTLDDFTHEWKIMYKED